MLLDSGVTTGRTRIAPTPSGYLHRGNLVHVLVVDTVARRLDLDVHLRIDAFDSPRVRPDYVRDIFRALDALQIGWDTGPRSPQDVNTPWESIDWHGELAAASHRGLSMFACRCSRRDRGAGRVCTCQVAGVAFIAGEAALRLDADRSGLDKTLHGTLLWRRDDVPSTHLASVITDRDSAITHVIRGADLAESSHAQRAIAPFFAADCVAHATFMHHDLLVTTAGEKLSKSAGSAARPIDMTPLLVGELREFANAFAQNLIQ